MFMHISNISQWIFMLLGFFESSSFLLRSVVFSRFEFAQSLIRGNISKNSDDRVETYESRYISTVPSPRSKGSKEKAVKEVSSSS